MRWSPLLLVLCSLSVTLSLPVSPGPHGSSLGNPLPGGGSNAPAPASPAPAPAPPTQRAGPSTPSKPPTPSTLPRSTPPPPRSPSTPAAPVKKPPSPPHHRGSPHPKPSDDNGPKSPTKKKPPHRPNRPGTPHHGLGSDDDPPTPKAPAKKRPHRPSSRKSGSNSDPPSRDPSPSRAPKRPSGGKHHGPTKPRRQRRPRTPPSQRQPAQKPKKPAPISRPKTIPKKKTPKASSYTYRKAAQDSPWRIEPSKSDPNKWTVEEQPRGTQRKPQRGDQADHIFEGQMLTKGLKNAGIDWDSLSLAHKNGLRDILNNKDNMQFIPGSLNNAKGHRITKTISNPKVKPASKGKPLSKNHGKPKKPQKPTTPKKPKPMKKPPPKKPGPTKKPRKKKSPAVDPASVLSYMKASAPMAAQTARDLDMYLKKSGLSSKPVMLRLLLKTYREEGVIRKGQTIAALPKVKPAQRH